MYMQLTATTVIMYYILGHEHGNRKSRMAMAFAMKTHTGAGIKVSRFLPTPRPSAQELNAVLIFDVTVVDLCSHVSLFFFGGGRVILERSSRPKKYMYLLTCTRN